MRKHVTGNVSWVGYIDWELESFHGDDYSIMNGSSQNAYLIDMRPFRVTHIQRLNPFRVTTNFHRLL